MRVSDPILKFCWKLCVLVLVMVLLGLRPAHSAPAETCEKVVSWTETAIEWRLSGYPAHTAKQEGELPLDRENAAIWRVIVDSVYEAPPETLTGSTRADWLTDLYRECRKLESGERL